MASEAPLLAAVLRADSDVFTTSSGSSAGALNPYAAFAAPRRSAGAVAYTIAVTPVARRASSLPGIGDAVPDLHDFVQAVDDEFEVLRKL